MTQESPPSTSRKSTARKSPERSPQNARTVSRFSAPGLSVATRKMAARVSGAATDCARARTPGATADAVVELGSIECNPSGDGGTPFREISTLASYANNRIGSLPKNRGISLRTRKPRRGAKSNDAGDREACAPTLVGTNNGIAESNGASG